MKTKKNKKSEEKIDDGDVKSKKKEKIETDNKKVINIEDGSKDGTKKQTIKRKRTYAVNEEIVKKLRKVSLIIFTLIFYQKDSNNDSLKNKCIFSDCDKSEDITLSEDKLTAIFEGGEGYHYICHTLPDKIDSWNITYSLKNKIENIAIGYGILPIFQKSPFSSPELCMYILNNGEAYERGELVYEKGIIPTNLIYPLRLNASYSKDYQKLKYSFGGYNNIYCFDEVPNEFIPCFVMWCNKRQEISIESISY